MINKYLFKLIKLTKLDLNLRIIIIYNKISNKGIIYIRKELLKLANIS